MELIQKQLIPARESSLQVDHLKLIFGRQMSQDFVGIAKMGIETDFIELRIPQHCRKRHGRQNHLNTFARRQGADGLDISAKELKFFSNVVEGFAFSHPNTDCWLIVFSA